ncbi:hypothetical protein Bbelb_282440 [Branchiostoma belcheri]|nr:hypothetical protein Bbelb_282440 [Branchiostoma belcheri]
MFETDEDMIVDNCSETLRMYLKEQERQKSRSVTPSPPPPPPKKHTETKPQTFRKDAYWLSFGQDYVNGYYLATNCIGNPPVRRLRVLQLRKDGHIQKDCFAPPRKDQ